MRDDRKICFDVPIQTLQSRKNFKKGELMAPTFPVYFLLTSRLECGRAERIHWLCYSVQYHKGKCQMPWMYSCGARLKCLAILFFIGDNIELHVISEWTALPLLDLYPDLNAKLATQFTT